MAAPDGGLIAPLAAAVGAVVPAPDLGDPDDRGNRVEVVVALGGGADSACLLAAAREALDGPLRGIFVDHGLEPGSTLIDAARALGDRLEVPVDVVEAPVDDGPDLERRTRDARYGAIDRALGPDAVVLTGHTRDDQAETVLMRLVDGSGSTGLAGIPHRRGRWVRPLLAFPRSELRRIAVELDLPFADDPANADDRFTRNRTRHDVMPVLESRLGSHATAGLARSASLLALDDAALEEMAARIPVLADDGGVEIPIGPLVMEPSPVASRACRRALRLIGDGYPGTSRDIAAILEVAGGGTGRSLSGGLQAVRNGPHVRIGPVLVPDPVDLVVGARVAWGGATYRMYEDDTAPVLSGGRFTVLRHDAISEGCTLRGATDGDRMDVGVGTTPVAEVLRAHGVAAPSRSVSPVAEIDGKIGAVVGVRTAAWASPDRGDRRVIIEREVGT